MVEKFDPVQAYRREGLYVDAADYDALAALLAKAELDRDQRTASELALLKRLAEAERLILRMSGEGYPRARFYVEQYDLTGERAAVSATVRQEP